jgi:transposase InsO family protein
VLSEHGCKIAPNTYYAHKKRAPSARAVRDEYLKGQIVRVHGDNLAVYGADKIWAALNREGIRVARCTVERLMRDLGLSGARRGKAFKVTTRHDDRQHRPDDLVNRNFVAPAPNRLWVADLTHVKTHAGWVYAAFIIDVYSRMVVGWQISNSLRFSLGDRRLGDGRVEPHPGRASPRWLGPSQRPRRAISQHPLASAWPKTTSWRRLEVGVIRMTTRWLRRSTASTSGNSSTPKGRGPSR